MGCPSLSISKRTSSTVEFDRSSLIAALAQYLCKTVESKDFFSEVAMACLDYFLGFLIGEAPVGACDCARDTWESTLASSSMTNTQLNVSSLSSGRGEHMPFERCSGSIGTTRSTRYTDVARFWASFSIIVSV